MTSVAASPTSAVRPSLCHMASRVCSITPSKPSSAGGALAVADERAAVDAAGARRAAVDLVEARGQPVDAAQHRVGAAEQEVPERRRLGVLEVGLVDHQRLGVGVGDPGDRGHEPGRRLDQVGDVAAHPQPQRDPHGLAAGPSGVQPTRVAPDRRGEPALAAVVDLTVRRVVAEVGPGRGDGSRSTPSNARAAASGMTPRSRRTSTCAISATFRPSCSSGASATSTANPASTSSGAYRLTALPRCP